MLFNENTESWNTSTHWKPYIQCACERLPDRIAQPVEGDANMQGNGAGWIVRSVRIPGWGGIDWEEHDHRTVYGQNPRGALNLNAVLAIRPAAGNRCQRYRSISNTATAEEAAKKTKRLARFQR